MAKKCVIKLSTPDGLAIAEVHVSSLHQLALLMPATVITYEVEDQGVSGRGPVSDSELYDLLIGLIASIGEGAVRR